MTTPNKALYVRDIPPSLFNAFHAACRLRGKSVTQTMKELVIEYIGSRKKRIILPKAPKSPRKIPYSGKPKTLNVHNFPASIHAAFAEACKKRNSSVSDTVRRLIVLYVAEHEQRMADAVKTQGEWK